MIKEKTPITKYLCDSVFTQKPSVFADQADFCTAAHIEMPTKDAKQLGMAENLVIEEFKEWVNEEKFGLNSNLNDLKEVIDLIYVCAQYLNFQVGAEKAESLWRVVHQHNMSKMNNGKIKKRKDGKVLKPAGFDKWAWIKEFERVLD